MQGFNPKRERIDLYELIMVRIIVLIFILFLDYRALFAQGASPAFRENLMFTTMDYAGKQQGLDRENVMLKAMKEAQGKLGKSEIAKKEGRSIFNRIASRAHPYLSETTALDDNVDSIKSGKKSSVTNTFVPGLKMNFRDKGRYLALDLHMNNTFYNKRRKNNSQSIGVDTSMALNVGRYLLTISDDYFNNYFATEKLGVDNNNYANYQLNTFASTLGRHFNRIGFDAGYSRAAYYYQPIFNSSDHTQEAFTFNQYLRIATKTRLLFKYARGRTNYTEKSRSSNSNTNDFNLSLSNVLSPKLTAMLEADYKLADSKGGDDSRETDLTGKIGHKISARSDLALSLRRVIYEQATKASYRIENDFALSANHRLAFNPKLSLSFNYGANYICYPKNTEVIQKDQNYTLGLGLNYAFKQWLDFSLSWAHAENRSNVSDDYYKNVFTFATQIEF